MRKAFVSHFVDHNGEPAGYHFEFSDGDQRLVVFEEIENGVDGVFFTGNEMTLNMESGENFEVELLDPATREERNE